MNRANTQIEEFLESQGVEFEPQEMVDRKDVEKRWLEMFAQKVKRATGSWICEGFKWHGFSYEHEEAIDGKSALHEYQGQWAAPYFVFDEEGIWSYKCSSKKYPDFTVLGADIYVVHHNMKWTMVFTHEQPHDGPYFAKRK